MLVKRATLELQAVPSLKLAALREKKIVPVDNDRYRYLRFRAIGCMEQNGLNGNFDGFPYEWFEDSEPGYGYKSFINKRAHYEHNSYLQHRGSIGDLPDAYLNNFIYPKDIKVYAGVDSNTVIGWAQLLSPKLGDKREEILNMPNQKDGAIEVLMRVDTQLLKDASLEYKTKEGLARLIRAIDSGQKVHCSMGVNVEYSKCTSCGNKARFSHEYCNHLTSGRKGSLSIVTANKVRDMLDDGDLRQEWLKHLVISSYDINEILKGSSNKGITIRNGEMNHKLSFFELSNVGKPAYEYGDALEKVATVTNNPKYIEFLKQERVRLGDNTLIDLYQLLQQEGKISSSCQTRW